jgi:hypothetical protein
MIATHELVVPKSIPIILPIFSLLESFPLNQYPYGFANKVLVILLKTVATPGIFVIFTQLSSARQSNSSW